MTTLAAAPLLPTYARHDVTFVSGEGVWLTDVDGRRYLDLLGGIAVVSLGHGHPAPLAAARRQLDALWHVSNLYSTEPMLQLAGTALGSLRRRAGVLLQLRYRGGRGGAQVGAEGDRQAGRRRARGLVPRPDARCARRHRAAGEARSRGSPSRPWPGSRS